MCRQSLPPTPEEELEGISTADWFGPEFTKSIFWYCWSTMLAFRDYHSVIEVKRYLVRFMMYASGITHLKGILHTEYNESPASPCETPTASATLNSPATVSSLSPTVR
ncbi:MAG: oleate hydratase [Acidimicrobiales bacterium]|jgi:myosin-crossreactive antigen